MDRLHLLGYAAAGMVWNDEGLGFEWVKACPATWVLKGCSRVEVIPLAAVGCRDPTRRAGR